ncbi:MAG: protein-export chaperone SecB [Rickettsiales bacterium]|nr:protein-export chaperone SecB [Rickettsiales bacterium]
MKEQNKAKIQLHSQYIKDLSFENPNAPQSLAQIAKNPNIGFNVNVNANKLNENYFEVALDIKASAKESEGEQNIIFQIELLYSSIFSISDYENEDELKKILLIEAPQLIFPFARRIIADVTRDGGFPPLIMDPIDFRKLTEKKEQNNSDKETDPNKH